MPDELRPLLLKHLGFLDRHPEGIDAAGRVALLRRARKEIGEILATEGYFSPAIEGEDGGEVLGVAQADIVVATMLFLDEHIRAVLPALIAWAVGALMHKAGLIAEGDLLLEA